MKLLIEGWISYPHSYSLVNTYQLLHLNKKEKLKIFLKELPPYKDEWNSFSSNETLSFIVTPEEQTILANIERWKGQPVDAVLRIAFPYDLSMTRGVESTLGSHREVPLLLFYTAEFQKLHDSNFTNGNVASFVTACFDKKITPVTPSKWSAEALRKKGFDPLVIPHGVDVTKFYPIAHEEEREERRKKFRNEFQIPLDAFVFLNVGAMTGNKNIKLMLKALYRLSMWKDNVFLVLKGIGDLYTCEKNITEAIISLISEGIISTKQWKEVSKKVIFIDELFYYDEMRILYNSCDCYLSPYIAEGFNLPVLEAAACGLPVIVSKGGPTDDFTKPSFAKYPKTYPCRNTNANTNTNTNSKEDGEVYLIVDEGSLIENMMEVIDNDVFRRNAQSASVKHVQENFTWDIVTEKLYNFLTYITPEIMPNMISNCHSDLASMP